MTRPKWGGAYAAKWVRLTLATFRRPLSSLWLRRPAREQRRSPDPAIARRAGHVGESSARASPAAAVELQSAAGEPAPARVVRGEPVAHPLDARPSTLARLVAP